jgi:hypothetical protein
MSVIGLPISQLQKSIMQKNELKTDHASRITHHGNVTCAVCGIEVVKGPPWQDQVMFDFTDPLCLLCFFWAVRIVEDNLTKRQKMQVNLTRTTS